MGHRKVHAPKRGSLAFLPRGRAAAWRGRIRNWPEAEAGPKLLAFAGFKAGMTYSLAIDSREGSLTFGKEVVIPMTIIETPPMLAVAIRAYAKDYKGLRTFAEAWMEKPPKDFERIISVPEKFLTEEGLNKIEKNLERIEDLRLVMATQPRLAKRSKKMPDMIEIKIGGGSIKERFEYGKKLVGSEVKVADIVKEGQAVDSIGITKGKGIQGPVKRWGIRRKFHKSRKTVREVGSIGGWTPHYVMYSVPRAGQMGFHQRTEYNKQIVKIGNNGAEVTPKGGFLRYGVVNSDYVAVKGSVPGVTNRLILIRLAVRPPPVEKSAAPKLEYVSVRSVQGD
ncbi:MAG TPA: 50S ribosomal protein L3 [Candidatus Saccharimonadales bacterium]|nr:50S ribosomal protein L3 [Candidatus Saccharimonadales bacterium]